MKMTMEWITFVLYRVMFRYLACSKRSDSGERLEEQGNGAENSMQKKKKKNAGKMDGATIWTLGTGYQVYGIRIFNL